MALTNTRYAARRRGWKQVHLVCGMTAMVLMTAAVGCQSKEEAPKTEVTVQAATASQEPISEHINADSVLFPLAQAAISPKITAPVKKFYVQRGARVKEGQLLATLENRDLAAAAMDNKGSLDQAKAGYETATKATVPEDYQKAELDLAQAQANLDVSQKVYDSRKALFAEGALPGRDLDTAHASLVQAQAAYDMAKHHLESQKTVSRADALIAAKGQLTSAEGKYQGAEAQLSYSEVRSPINGVVTDRPLYAGETAAAGAPLLTVMDTSALIAKLHIPQAEAQQLKVGAPAQVKISGVDEPVTGKVTLISPALDTGSTTVELWVRVDNKKGELKAGTPAKVSITSETVPDAIVVPSVAVQTDAAGKKTVMVIGGDSLAHQREVEIGVEDGEKTQITKGLKVGEQVVSVGAYAMDDGTKVKVVSAEEQEKENAPEKPAAGKSGGDD